MRQTANKLFTVLMLMVFVFGVSACVSACLSGCEDLYAGADEAPQCAVQCSCASLSLPPLGHGAPSPRLDLQTNVVDDERLTLPLFAASIFNPPKA